MIETIMNKLGYVKMSLVEDALFEMRSIMEEQTEIALNLHAQLEAALPLVPKPKRKYTKLKVAAPVTKRKYTKLK